MRLASLLLCLLVSCASGPVATLAQPPSPSSEAKNTTETIPLVKKGGVYEIPVEINGVITLKFILDTGASEVNIPADVALTLYRTGTVQDANFLSGQTYRLADGSQVKSARFMLRSLKIGQHRIHNVAASIGNVSSSLLLGQSFLEKLGAWGIDSTRQAFVVGSGSKPQKDEISRLTSPELSERTPGAGGGSPKPPKPLRNSLSRGCKPLSEKIANFHLSRFGV